MYITYNEYTALYDPIEEKVFNLLAYDACRHIDRHTTGIDGVKKLKIAFPTDEDSAEAVKRCAARITNLLVQLMEAEKSASLFCCLVCKWLAAGPTFSAISFFKICLRFCRVFKIG